MPRLQKRNLFHGQAKVDIPLRLRDPQASHHRGYFAHEDISPSCWCVMKEDLVKLRMQVKEGIDRNQIAPTEHDPFDPNDNLYGPSVYTVVNQLLKGVSYMDGGCSWALTQHPDGLECDLFISHAWSEGIFEFIDKVVHAWPQGTWHAYCCMLSNPHTLNIGDLIASPIDSPFAKALQCAKHVLVVPNHKGSIYNRCWCTYDFFLAYKWNKTITVATPPSPGVWKNASLLLLIFAASVGMSFVSHRYLQSPGNTSHKVDSHFAVIERVIRLLAVLMPDRFQATHGLANISGLVFSGTINGGKLHLYICLGWRSNRAFTEKVVDVAFWILITMVYVFNYIDLMWYKQLAAGRAQLATGYSGRICDSEAFDEEDKNHILNEIRHSDGEEMADKTIAVLLKSGMCSKSLRMAHDLGVDISGVGVVKLKLIWVAFTFSCLTTMHPTTFRRNDKYEYPTAAANIVTLTCVVLWTARMYYKLHQADQRAFMAAVAWKMFGLPILLFEIASGIISSVTRFISSPDLEILDDWLQLQVFWATPFCCCLALLVSLPDFARLASIPVVGISLATFLATSDLHCDCRRESCSGPVASAPLVTVFQDGAIELSALSSCKDLAAISGNIWKPSSPD